MKQRAGVLVLLFASTAITTTLVYAHGPSAKEPLWAYGFPTPPTLADKAPPPQNPPTRRLRPNEDRDEQTRRRRVAGSGASYTLVDVRDGHNVIDWFPSDDFQQGTRNGASAPLMRLVVANLTEEDIVSITAYLASLGGAP